VVAFVWTVHVCVQAAALASPGASQRGAMVWRTLTWLTTLFTITVVVVAVLVRYADVVFDGMRLLLPHAVHLCFVQLYVDRKTAKKSRWASSEVGLSYVVCMPMCHCSLHVWTTPSRLLIRPAAAEAAGCCARGRCCLHCEQLA
jgi:hypothetical protein